MPQMLLAAVHQAATQIGCLSSLALTITDVLENAGGTVDPMEQVRVSADMARITFDQLKFIEGSLIAAQDAASARFSLADCSPEQLVLLG